jgi:hypothetical protein
MAMSGGKDDGSPMMEMNTTPLIDVMLVLLIMFIITIPVATHAVNIDLPVPNPNQSTCKGGHRAALFLSCCQGGRGLALADLGTGRADFWIRTKPRSHKESVPCTECNIKPSAFSA